VIAAKKRQYAETGMPDVLDDRAVAILRGWPMPPIRPAAACCRRSMPAIPGWPPFGLRCHDLLHYWFPVYNPAFAGSARATC